MDLTGASIILSSSSSRNLPGMREPMVEPNIDIIQASVPESRHNEEVMGAAMIGMCGCRNNEIIRALRNLVIMVSFSSNAVATSIFLLIQCVLMFSLCFMMSALLGLMDCSDHAFQEASNALETGARSTISMHV